MMENYRVTEKINEKKMQNVSKDENIKINLKDKTKFKID
jgi:hypothetical protein